MNFKTTAIASAVIALLAAGCSDENAGAPQKNLTLNGAGASFPAPVYQNWTHNYTESHPGIKVNYQSLGSGAGINQIKAGTVDFAGTDNPLTQKEQQEAGLQQFPMLTGGVVVIANIPGVADGELKLDRAALADLFLGKITSWDDARLVKLNPGLKLPKLPVTVVHRADASGTSFIFTDYLSKISAEWKQKAGAGASVKWPVGIGGQKNPGVCNSVAKIKGAVGYTEYTYAVEAKLAMPQLENREGNFVKADPKGFQSGAASAKWTEAPGFYMVLTDQPGKDSWPIVGVTYILIRKDCSAEKRAELLKYFNWCFTAGQTAAKQLNYVPIPENVINLIQKEVFE